MTVKIAIVVEGDDERDARQKLVDFLAPLGFRDDRAVRQEIGSAEARVLESLGVDPETYFARRKGAWFERYQPEPDLSDLRPSAN